MKKTIRAKALYDFRLLYPSLKAGVLERYDNIKLLLPGSTDWSPMGFRRSYTSGNPSLQAGVLSEKRNRALALIMK